MLYNLLILAPDQKTVLFSQQLLSNFRYKKQPFSIFLKKLRAIFLDNLEQLVESPNQGYGASIALKN